MPEHAKGIDQTPVSLGWYRVEYPFDLGPSASGHAFDQPAPTGGEIESHLTPVVTLPTP
jgi:hypothetical protein